MTTSALLAFIGITVLAYVTPGPDWFVVIRYAARSRRSGLISGVGVSCGLLVHMTAAAVGVRSLMNSRRTSDHTATSDRVDLRACSVLRRSFVANVLNPKAAIFFVAVLPQFLTPGTPVAPQVLLLGAIDIALGLIWWTLFATGIDRIQRVVNAEHGRRIIDRIAGVCLIGLGTGLALLKPATRIAP